MHLLLLLLTLLAPAATIGPWPYPTTHVLHHVVVVGKIDCFVPPPTGLIGTYLPTVYNSVSLRYGAFNRTDELA